MAKSGSLSINSENIFPIIKKWLYSDHDIFYRELMCNGCDAITKLKKLDADGRVSSCRTEWSIRCPGNRKPGGKDHQVYR